MRCFIAIDLPETVKAELAGFQQELKEASPDVRWTRPEGTHLTLKFLGEIGEDTAEEIAKKLTGICAGRAAFSLRIAGTGVFPNVRSPRVLWAGVELNDDMLQLHREVEDAADSLGFDREKRSFSPHLTLGRFRSSRGKREVLGQMAEQSGRVFGIIDVDSVSLMKSELNPKGAKYTQIGNFKFQISNAK